MHGAVRRDAAPRTFHAPDGREDDRHWEDPCGAEANAQVKRLVDELVSCSIAPSAAGRTCCAEPGSIACMRDVRILCGLETFMLTLVADMLVLWRFSLCCLA